MDIHINNQFNIGDKFEATYVFPHINEIKRVTVIHEIIGIVVDIGKQWYKPLPHKYRETEVGFAYRMTDPSRHTGSDIIMVTEQQIGSRRFKKL